MSCRQIRFFKIKRTNWRFSSQATSGFAVVLTLVFLLSEASRAACSTPTANAGSLDFQSGVFNYCDGTNWVALGAGGSGGRTSCPTGFSLIGTSGSLETFCISTTEETAKTMLAATTTCHNKNPRTRLCSLSEWAMACVSGIPTGMTDNYEWVAHWRIDSAQLAGFSSCGNSSATMPGSSITFRCCFR